MILRNCNMAEFIRRIEGKKTICFGAGMVLQMLSRDFPKYQIEKRILYIVDNNSNLWGSEVVLSETAVPVYSPEKLIADACRDIVVLISSWKAAPEIFEQLNANSRLDIVECYIGSLLHETESRNLPYSLPAGYRVNLNPVIPKVIHYFWLGSNPLPERHKRFIDGWRKFCPDYEIVEWNENNYDINKHQYTKDAALAGRWSKVVTYARFDVIYNYGGICMDTDVEIVKPLDELLYNDAYIGFSSGLRINSGSGFGAVKNFELFRDMRHNYDGTLFNSDDTPNLTSNSAFEIDFMLKRGLNRNGDFQMLDRLTVYPLECFDPKPNSVHSDNGSLWATENTFTIHHYDTTLADKERETIRTSLGKLYEAALINEKKHTDMAKKGVQGV